MKIKSNFIDAGFETALLLKGINGLLEIIGGSLLIFVTPDRLDRLVALLTQHELLEDPGDLLAKLLFHISGSFSASTRTFSIIYLMAHGIIKVILATLLLRKKRWAYPFCMLLITGFLLYQVHRILLFHSIFLMFLSLFDVAVLVFTWLEYQKIMQRKASSC